MISNLFWYKRRVNKGKKEGTDIEEIIIVHDCLNVNKIVRGFWRSEKVFSLMLDDGHEQAEDREKEIIKNGKVVGRETKRERDWFITQIDLDEEDAMRLSSVSGGPKPDFTPL